MITANNEYTAVQQAELEQQDEAFAQVWQMHRDNTNAGPSRPLVCPETMAANRSHCYD